MKRKHDHEEHESSERWLVSYADFITLLFAFFVVLYATSTQNVEKEKQFEESIREQMKIPPQGGGGAGGSGQGLAQQALGEAAEVSPNQGGDSERQKLARSAELEEEIEKAIGKSMTEEEKKQISELRHDAFGVRMNLAASSVFPTGSAKLRRESLPVLDKLASILKGSEFKMLIEGHTDDVPVTGGEFDSNWELASARATQVVRYLTKVRQVPANRLAAVAYADQRPLVPNSSEENRARNRRIEILLITAETPFDDF